MPAVARHRLASPDGTPPPPPPPDQIVFSVCNEDAATCAEPDPPAPGDRPPVPELPPIDPPNGTTWYRPTTPLPDPQAVINNSYECGGWAGTRVYLEAQTWFTRSARDPSAESTQLHVGACLPHKQKVRRGSAAWAEWAGAG